MSDEILAFDSIGCEIKQVLPGDSRKANASVISKVPPCDFSKDIELFGDTLVKVIGPVN